MLKNVTRSIQNFINLKTAVLLLIALLPTSVFSGDVTYITNQAEALSNKPNSIHKKYADIRRLLPISTLGLENSDLQDFAKAIVGDPDNLSTNKKLTFPSSDKWQFGTSEKSDNLLLNLKNSNPILQDVLGVALITVHSESGEPPGEAEKNKITVELLDYVFTPFLLELYEIDELELNFDQYQNEFLRATQRFNGQLFTHLPTTKIQYRIDSQYNRIMQKITYNILSFIEINNLIRLLNEKSVDLPLEKIEFIELTENLAMPNIRLTCDNTLQDSQKK